MVAKEIIQREQEFVDTAVEARESRRSDRESGKYSLAGALATPIKTMAGGRLQKLKELGDKGEDVCFANVISEENERQYIGKFPIHDADSELLVSSWKSPVGRLFYRSNIKNPLGLAGKSRIIFDNPNHVKDVEENLYKELKTRIQNLTKNAESDVSDAVLDELEKGSSGSLKRSLKPFMLHNMKSSAQNEVAFT